MTCQQSVSYIRLYYLLRYISVQWIIASYDVSVVLIWGQLYKQSLITVIVVVVHPVVDDAPDLIEPCTSRKIDLVFHMTIKAFL